jgi:hypothetical protein
MTQASPRPLHRLTPLLDDPLAAWLTRPQRLRVALTRWFGWAAFAVFLILMWCALLVLIRGVLGLFDHRVPSVVTVMAGLGLIWPARRMVMRRCTARMAELVRESVPARAVPIDDIGGLEEQADGTLVSIVGWIRARDQLPEPVDGEPCVGLALACHQKYPGVLETLNDFDLVDEGARSALVQVAGARMLGESNVNLTDGKARRLLIASLDLPVGTVANGWDAFVLRDGDPVMAVGFKQTAIDPAQSSLRGPPARVAVCSMEPKPMLIFPIAAERRPQAPDPSNSS